LSGATISGHALLRLSGAKVRVRIYVAAPLDLGSNGSGNVATADWVEQSNTKILIIEVASKGF
jgi:hypothetical protein